jgi:hypothetical protein
MKPNTSDHLRTDGWDWLDPNQAPEIAADNEVIRSFARCFSGSDGARVVDYLRLSVLERRLGPNATDAELRFLEGQRLLVARIISMIDRGQP